MKVKSVSLLGEFRQMVNVWMCEGLGCNEGVLRGTAEQTVNISDAVNLRKDGQKVGNERLMFLESR